MLKRIVATALAMAFVLSLTTGLAVAAAKPAPAGKVNIKNRYVFRDLSFVKGSWKI